MEFTSHRNALLSGIRILDFADEKASFCTKLLADMGARVIKVEKTGGDASRNIGPFLKRTSQCKTSLSFYYNNTNKLGITLNLEHKEGQAIFLKLVKETDVIVETFPPRYLRKRGLDFETLRSVNSRLILVSATGFGQRGPRSDYKACDLVLSAYGGQMFVCGSPSAAPLKAYGDQSYCAASLFAVVGVLLALRNRDKTGTGEHLSISLQESVTATLEHVLVRYFSTGIVHRRQGSLHWNDSFVIFPCKDGFIQATIFQQWETLVEWVAADGMAEDLTDAKWLDEDYRRQGIEHVLSVLRRWTKTKHVDELFMHAQLMRFPWAPVQSPNEMLGCPQLNARDFFIRGDCPESGITLRYPGTPYKISGECDLPNMPAPLPGEHNELIYQQELGISEEDLKQLYIRKVI